MNCNFKVLAWLLGCAAVVFAACGEITIQDVDTDSAGDSADTDADTDTDTDTDSDTDTDTDSDTNSDSETDTAADTGADTGTQAPDVLRVEAECAFGNVGQCTGGFTGSDSKSPTVPEWEPKPGIDTYPALQNNDTAVGYFNGGTWISISALNLTGYTKVVLAIAAKSPESGTIGFEVRIDSAGGEKIADITVIPSEDWYVYAPHEVSLMGTVSGVHDVYIIAKTADIGNGNIDWFEFKK